MNPKDPSNFRQMLLDSPDQFKAGFEIADGIKLEGNFKSIMLSGMGGSALPGNILRVYLSELFKENLGHTRFEVYQNRYYSLPHESFDNCLNFLMSYSGNTEETIESFKEVLENKLPAIGVSSGGKIEQICKENEIPHIKMPMPFADFQPRLGTGYFFGALVQVLINQGMIPDTKDQILAAAAKLKENVKPLENRGKELAEKIKGKTPVFYTSTKFKPIAMVWKIMINENGKTPAFWNFFPELNHNEMNGFVTRQGEFVAIMLRDSDDHPRNHKRFEVTAKILKDIGMESEILDYEKGDVFYKMFSSILLGGFTSYYLALEYGNDPTPVNLVEKFKKLLEE